MKRFNLFALLLFVSTIFLFSCGGGSEEPNNTIEEAKAVKFDEITEIKISPLADWDWFKFDVTEKGYVKVSTQTIPEGLELECYFALYEEWEGTKEKKISEYMDFPAIICVEPGTYYFVVKDNYDDKESSEAIPLKVEFIKEFDSFENNNDAENAKETTVNSEFKIGIFPKADIEWFKMKVEKPGNVKIMSKNVPADMEIEVVFYKYNEWADPKSEQISEYLKLPCAYQIATPGDYYIAFNDNYNDLFSEQLFDIKVEFVEQNDLCEPNNEFQNAKEVNVGDTLKLAVFPVGDVDYYKIKVDKAGKLSLMSKGSTGDVNLEARFFELDPQKTEQLITRSEYMNLPCQFNVLPNIQYYFLIEDNYSDNQLEELVEVKIELQ
jgi:hypothetical protein